jgi:arylsulfatase B
VGELKEELRCKRGAASGRAIAWPSEGGQAGDSPRFTDLATHAFPKPPLTCPPPAHSSTPPPPPLQHVGLATPDHTPKGRGFKHSLTYLDGANDYFTSTTTGWCDTADPTNGVPFTDLWGSDGPAFGKNNSWACSQTNQPPSCQYEDTIFTNFTVAQIAAHDPATPLFLYFAAHNVHEPLECPEAQLDRFQFVYDTCAAAEGGEAIGKNNSCATQVLHPELGSVDGKTIKQCCFRQYYSAMTNLVDQHIGQVLAALRSRGMYDNALITLASDNGGPIYRNGAAGANNHPHRGGKKSNFEGGVRVNALASGGLIPTSMRGKTLEDWTAMEDLYVTYCGLAGVSTEDEKAKAAGLPGVDGVDLWPLLSGANSTGPRAEIWLGSGGAGDEDNSKDPIVQAYIRADGYKVLYGNVNENTWTGPFYPNASTNW